MKTPFTLESRIFYIDILLEGFAQILNLSCEGVDIFLLDFNDFEFPDGESALTASRLLHNDDNHGLVKKRR